MPPVTSHRIHIFRAEATASPGNATYRPGARHALMVFVRQPAEAEYDWANAELVTLEMGWEDVVISRAGTLNLQPATTDDVLNHAHRDAAANGSSIVVYADPINST
jgi:hypothetical protein